MSTIAAYKLPEPSASISMSRTITNPPGLGAAVSASDISDAVNTVRLRALARDKDKTDLTTTPPPLDAGGGAAGASRDPTATGVAAAGTTTPPPLAKKWWERLIRR